MTDLTDILEARGNQQAKVMKARGGYSPLAKLERSYYEAKYIVTANEHKPISKASHILYFFAHLIKMWKAVFGEDYFESAKK